MHRRRGTVRGTRHRAAAVSMAWEMLPTTANRTANTGVAGSAEGWVRCSTKEEESWTKKASVPICGGVVPLSRLPKSTRVRTKLICPLLSVALHACCGERSLVCWCGKWRWTMAWRCRPLPRAARRFRPLLSPNPSGSATQRMTTTLHWLIRSS